MKKLVILFVLITLLLFGCDTQPETQLPDNDTLLATMVSETIAAMQSDQIEPTVADIPPTVEPTQTPHVVPATNTPRPDFGQIYEFNGAGKGTTDLFELQEGTVKVTWTYIGSSNFSFDIKRLDNDSYDMLENAIGNTEGQAIFNVGWSDEYLFDIRMGQGDWNIIVEWRP
jgi:hypothetical protein